MIQIDIPHMTSSNDTQVSLFHHFILLKGPGCSGEGDLAGLHHIPAAGDIQRDLGILLDQQDRGALPVDLQDAGKDALDRKSVV